MFIENQPFPYTVIDGFFEESTAEGLLSDFPPFDHERAKNEFGQPSQKYTVADIAAISPFYKQVYKSLLSG